MENLLQKQRSSFITGKLKEWEVIDESDKDRDSFEKDVDLADISDGELRGPALSRHFNEERQSAAMDVVSGSILGALESGADGTTTYHPSSSGVELGDDKAADPAAGRDSADHDKAAVLGSLERAIDANIIDEHVAHAFQKAQDKQQEPLSQNQKYMTEKQNQLLDIRERVRRMQKDHMGSNDGHSGKINPTNTNIGKRASQTLSGNQSRLSQASQAQKMNPPSIKPSVDTGGVSGSQGLDAAGNGSFAAVPSAANATLPTSAAQASASSSEYTASGVGTPEVHASFWSNSGGTIADKNTTSRTMGASMKDKNMGGSSSNLSHARGRAAASTYEPNTTGSFRTTTGQTEGSTGRCGRMSESLHTMDEVTTDDIGAEGIGGASDTGGRGASLKWSSADPQTDLGGAVTQTDAPTTDIDESSRGLAAIIEDSRDSAAKIRNSRGSAATIGNSRGSAVTIGNSRGSAAIIGNSRGSAAMIGNSKGSAAIIRNSRDSAAIMGKSRGSAAIVGNSRGSAGIIGNSRGSAAILESNFRVSVFEGISNSERIAGRVSSSQRIAANKGAADKNFHNSGRTSGVASPANISPRDGQNQSVAGSQNESVAGGQNQSGVVAKKVAKSIFSPGAALSSAGKNPMNMVASVAGKATEIVSGETATNLLATSLATTAGAVGTVAGAVGAVGKKAAGTAGATADAIEEVRKSAVGAIDGAARATVGAIGVKDAGKETDIATLQATFEQVAQQLSSALQELEQAAQEYHESSKKEEEMRWQLKKSLEKVTAYQSRCGNLVDKQQKIADGIQDERVRESKNLAKRINKIDQRVRDLEMQLKQDLKRAQVYVGEAQERGNSALALNLQSHVDNMARRDPSTFGSLSPSVAAAALRADTGTRSGGTGTGSGGTGTEGAGRGRSRNRNRAQSGKKNQFKPQDRLAQTHTAASRMKAGASGTAASGLVASTFGSGRGSSPSQLTAKNLNKIDSKGDVAASLVSEIEETESDLIVLENQQHELSGHVMKLNDVLENLNLQKGKLCCKYTLRPEDADRRFSYIMENITDNVAFAVGSSSKESHGHASGHGNGDSYDFAKSGQLLSGHGLKEESNKKTAAILQMLSITHEENESMKMEVKELNKSLKKMTEDINREQAKMLRLDREYSAELDSYDEKEKSAGLRVREFSSYIESREDQIAEREILRIQFKKTEKELENLCLEFDVKRQVLQASAKDVSYDIEQRRVGCFTDAEESNQQLMIQVRLDQLAAFETRLANHEEEFKLKKIGLENWLRDHELAVMKAGKEPQNLAEIRRDLEELRANHDKIKSEKTALESEREQALEEIDFKVKSAIIERDTLRMKKQEILNEISKEKKRKRDEALSRQRQQHLTGDYGTTEKEKLKYKFHKRLGSGPNVIFRRIRAEEDEVQSPRGNWGNTNELIHVHEWIGSTNTKTHNEPIKQVENNKQEYKLLERVYEEIAKIHIEINKIKGWDATLEAASETLKRKLALKASALEKYVNEGKEVAPRQTAKNVSGIAKFSGESGNENSKSSGKQNPSHNTKKSRYSLSPQKTIDGMMSNSEIRASRARASDAALIRLAAGGANLANQLTESSAGEFTEKEGGGTTPENKGETSKGRTSRKIDDLMNSYSSQNKTPMHFYTNHISSTDPSLTGSKDQNFGSLLGNNDPPRASAGRASNRSSSAGRISNGGIIPGGVAMAKNVASAGKGFFSASRGLIGNSVAMMSGKRANSADAKRDSGTASSANTGGDVVPAATADTGTGTTTAGAATGTTRKSMTQIGHAETFHPIDARVDPDGKSSFQRTQDRVAKILSTYRQDEQLQENVEKVRRRIVKKERDIDFLREEKKRLEKEMGGLEHHLKKAIYNDTKHLVCEVEKIQQQIRNEQARVETLKAQHASANAVKQQMEESLVKIDQEATFMEQQSEELRNQLISLGVDPGPRTIGHTMGHNPSDEQGYPHGVFVGGAQGYPHGVTSSTRKTAEQIIEERGLTTGEDWRKDQVYEYQLRDQAFLDMDQNGDVKNPGFQGNDGSRLHQGVAMQEPDPNHQSPVGGKVANRSRSQSPNQQQNVTGYAESKYARVSERSQSPGDGDSIPLQREKDGFTKEMLQYATNLKTSDGNANTPRAKKSPSPQKKQTYHPSHSRQRSPPPKESAAMDVSAGRPNETRISVASSTGPGGGTLGSSAEPSRNNATGIPHKKGLPPNIHEISKMTTRRTPLKVNFPNPDDIRIQFGDEHPAFLFYAHLHPLLIGIPVQIEKKGALQRRIVSVSADYGRIKIQSDDKVVNESFIPVRNLRSVNVPDPTLRLLHNLSENLSEIAGVKQKHSFQLHVLLNKGEPLRITVPTIHNFHLLTQSFKIICETPKEQLAYFAVVLGLGN